MDPEQSDLGPHFCHIGFLNISADEKSRRIFFAIGTLMVNFFACQVILHALLLSVFFTKFIFLEKKKSLRKPIRMKDILDPDQAHCSVRPNTGPNSL